MQVGGLGHCWSYWAALSSARSDPASWVSITHVHCGNGTAQEAGPEKLGLSSTCCQLSTRAADATLSRGWVGSRLCWVCHLRSQTSLLQPGHFPARPSPAPRLPPPGAPPQGALAGAEGSALAPDPCH